MLEFLDKNFQYSFFNFIFMVLFFLQPFSCSTFLKAMPIKYEFKDEMKMEDASLRYETTHEFTAGK